MIYINYNYYYIGIQDHLPSLRPEQNLKQFYEGILSPEKFSYSAF